MLSKLVTPRYPTNALGLEKGFASVVELERTRNNGARLRRAASVGLDESLVRPSFDETNIADPSELASIVSDLTASAGLVKQKKWSVALPEASTRSAILILETAPGSNSELEEMLTWKMERTFGIALDELSISREKLLPDAQGRARYLIVAARLAVLDEYETVFRALGWRTGMLLPRHMCEGQWLTTNGAKGDGLLLSSSEHGFTALVFRGKEPLILRTVACEPQDCEDEFYRLLLFYRDRRATDNEAALSRLLVLGQALPKSRAAEIVNETLGTSLKPLVAPDLGLEIPSREISFDAIAAPAGLATLSWR